MKWTNLRHNNLSKFNKLPKLLKPLDYFNFFCQFLVEVLNRKFDVKFRFDCMINYFWKFLNQQSANNNATDAITPEIINIFNHQTTTRIHF